MLRLKNGRQKNRFGKKHQKENKKENGLREQGEKEEKRKGKEKEMISRQFKNFPRVRTYHTLHFQHE